ncbi:MAG: ATP-binding cassette domain-containing protein [Mollicutes bacterium]|nr:ATP-binding cassette domain-containing protein [Mollicutes bacterium]
MPNIELKELYCYYGKGKKENLVIEDMTEYFPSGKISVIMGPSGCGKTTLLKSILGLMEYDGDIFFDDKDIYKIPTYQRNMAYINQDVSLYPHWTIFENIIFPLKNKKMSRDEIYKRARDIAERFGIAHCLNVKPKYLSWGQQQRALLARELVGEPEVVLMDEPVSHLDKLSKKDVLDFIKELNREWHLTILYVTHSYQEAMEVADQIYVMDQGKFIEKGTPKSIQASINHFVCTMRAADDEKAKE